MNDNINEEIEKVDPVDSDSENEKKHDLLAIKDKMNGGKNEEITYFADTDFKPKGFFAKVENFWYHYKWHSLIALFLVFTVTICSLQMCSKKEYDINILYAGEHGVNRENKGGDASEYNKILSSLETVSKDTNGDGDLLVSFRDLFILDEIDSDTDKKPNDSELQRSYQDGQTLSYMMISSEYFICLFSSDLYESYTKDKEVVAYPFVPLTANIIGDESKVEYYDESKCAIKLSSLNFYKNPGIKQLPADTVLCLKKKNVVSNLSSKAVEEAYNASLECIKAIASTGLYK